MEAEFAQICWDIYDIDQNIMHILYFVEALCQLGEFSQVRLKKLIQLVLSGQWIRPNKRQWCKIMLEEGYRKAYIAKTLGYTRKTVYEIDKADDINLPPHFVHGLTEIDYVTMIGFVELVHKFQNLGVQHGEDKKRKIISDF